MGSKITNNNTGPEQLRDLGSFPNTRRLSASCIRTAPENHLRHTQTLLEKFLNSGFGDFFAQFNPRFENGLHDDESIVMFIPVNKRYTNRFGSIQAPALLAGAELLVGIHAHAMMDKLNVECSFLVKRVEADFKRRASADVYFFLGKASEQTVRRSIDWAESSGKRANTKISISAAVSEAGTRKIVATFEMMVSFKKAPQQSSVSDPKPSLRDAKNRFRSFL